MKQEYYLVLQRTDCEPKERRRRFANPILYHRLLVAVAAGASTAAGQAEASAAKYDAQSRTFRMDGSGVSHVFGVNEKGELQSLYRGNTVGKNDAFPTPHSAPGRASFDASVNATPHTPVAWR